MLLVLWNIYAPNFPFLMLILFVISLIIFTFWLLINILASATLSNSVITSINGIFSIGLFPKQERDLLFSPQVAYNPYFPFLIIKSCPWYLPILLLECSTISSKRYSPLANLSKSISVLTDLNVISWPFTHLMVGPYFPII